VPEAEPLYNLKAVIQQTGIPAASLRAWEKRYGVPAPVRKPNGHRVYPRSEVEKLLAVKRLMARGMTISQAVDQLGHAAEPPPQPPAGEVERLQQQLGAALAGLDTAQANAVIGHALDLLTVPQVALRLIKPLLPAVSPFGRSYLRTRLGALLVQASPRPDAPVALVMAPRPEDLRPLLAAVLLSRRDYRVIYVEGAEAPEGLRPDLTIDPRLWRGDVAPDQLFQ